MDKTPTANGLGADAAQELITHALTLLTNEKTAADATSAIAAALELARESVLAAGGQALSITGIDVGIAGDDASEEGSTYTVFNAQPTSSGPQKRTPVDARPRRIPIAYGGTGYSCFLVSYGPPPAYVCIYF